MFKTVSKFTFIAWRDIKQLLRVTVVLGAEGHG